jgi:uncharacterized cupredoxin-like copper-binding protein
MRVSRLVCLSLVLPLVALGAVGCGNDLTANGGSGAQSGATGNTPAANTVTVNQKDFSITLDRATVAAGEVTLVIRNAGPSAHELRVFRTDLPEDQLPTASTGDVNETGPGVTRVAATPSTTSPGGTQQLTATLTPGRYVLICNLPAHYRLGMHTVLIVG